MSSKLKAYVSKWNVYIRAEKRRLQPEVNSVRTQSTTKSGERYRSEEREAIRAIPQDLRTDKTADDWA